MEDPLFKSAWSHASASGECGWAEAGGVPDIRWRAHVAIWTAQHVISQGIEGDFVECGVHTGLLSLSVCEFLNFGSLADRKFWLFDTWDGIPASIMTPSEKEMAEKYNATIYKNDIYASVQGAFSKFQNVNLVKGIIPNSFSTANIDKIAYLSVDLNNAAPEKASINHFWPKISQGGFVIIDDYGWSGHGNQQIMWDDFAASHNKMILTLPTGQGLLIK